MRGSRKITSREAREVGIIPAGAGLTPEAIRGVCNWRDHPRGCGAHISSSVANALARGSSPRVRGSLLLVPQQVMKRGIIPAGAGLTQAGGCARLPCWDHPRGCGAHPRLDNNLAVEQGSSPRVRGSLAVDKIVYCYFGIIPAGAGLTHPRAFPRSPSWDHPRGCGAHNNKMYYTRGNWGSSPRVRGSRLLVLRNLARDGIIPAGAGLTSPTIQNYMERRDHPRGCGAHSMTEDRRPMMKGSSPRVRGSLVDDEHISIMAGIIPAGAGLTPAVFCHSCHWRDHPRGCGAHLSDKPFSLKW